MKKLTIITLGLILLLTLAGCFPKASEAIRALPVESKEQIMAQYSKNQLEEGSVIFVNNCGKCHKLKEPASHTPAEWNKIVKRMIPRAKLSDDEGKLVRAYLIANAKGG